MPSRLPLSGVCPPENFSAPRRSAKDPDAAKAGPRRLALFLGVVALAAVCGPNPAPRAQSKRAMTLVDLLNMPRVAVDSPQLTRDGRRIAFTMLTTDWPGNRRIPQIWQIGADGTGLRRLTSMEAGAITPLWSPDNSSLAFLSRGAIFVLTAEGGAPRQISHHATGVQDMAWQPDGAAMYFLANDPPTDAQRERNRLRGDVVVLDEFTQRHLWKVAVADGKEQRLTGGDYSITAFNVGANGSLVVSRAPSPTNPDAEQKEIWSLKPDGSPGVQLTHNKLEELGVALSPDGSQVLFVARANDRQEPLQRQPVPRPAAGAIRLSTR